MSFVFPSGPLESGAPAVSWLEFMPWQDSGCLLPDYCLGCSVECRILMRNWAPAVELWCFLPGEWAQEVLWFGGWAGLSPQGLKAIWWKPQDGEGRPSPFLSGNFPCLVLFSAWWLLSPSGRSWGGAWMAEDWVLFLAEVRFTFPTQGERRGMDRVYRHSFRCFQKCNSFPASFNYKGNTCSQCLCQKK